VKNLAIALQDPATDKIKLVASPLAKATFREKILTWYDVPANAAELAAENNKLKAEMASLGGDTGWEA
jgi:hypothetical protein